MSYKMDPTVGYSRIIIITAFNRRKKCSSDYVWTVGNKLFDIKHVLYLWPGIYGPVVTGHGQKIAGQKWPDSG